MLKFQYPFACGCFNTNFRLNCRYSAIFNIEFEDSHFIHIMLLDRRSLVAFFCCFNLIPIIGDLRTDFNYVQILFPLRSKWLKQFFFLIIRAWCSRFTNLFISIPWIKHGNNLFVKALGICFQFKQMLVLQSYMNIRI